MKVLKVKPNKLPKVIEIDDELETLQGEVGGYIEAVYPFRDNTTLICNEEGKIIGLPCNRALYDDGKMIDVICGDFLIAGLDDDGFASLSDEQIETYTEMFGADSFFKGFPR